MKNLVIIFSTLLAGLCSTIYSQQVYRTGYDKHEFSISGSGGIFGLNYSPAAGSQTNGFGGGFGLGYHFFFSPYWGVGTGVEFSLYNSKFDQKNDNLRHHYVTVDFVGDNFIFSSVATGFSEKQKASMLQIPIMLQYQTGGLFYAAAGAKVAIPVSSSFNSSGNIQNTGWFSHEQYPYREDPALGLSSYPNFSGKGDLEIKAAVLASIEAGVKLRLTNKTALYIGAFLDYGLNNVNKNKGDLNYFVHYNSADRNFDVNGILHSHSATFTGDYATADAKNSRAIADKFSPLAFGLKVRLSLGTDGRGGGGRGTVTASSQPRQQEQPAEDDAARRAAEEAARRAAEDLARENEAARRALEDAARAEREAVSALMSARSVIEKPTDGYEINESVLDDRQTREFQEKVAALRQYPNIRVNINGHTCDIGADDVNQRVGMERAQRARDYLISQGISENRILILTSKRDTEPLVPNSSEENRKTNRRVQLLIVD